MGPHRQYLISHLFGTNNGGVAGNRVSQQQIVFHFIATSGRAERTPPSHSTTTTTCRSVFGIHSRYIIFWVCSDRSWEIQNVYGQVSHHPCSEREWPSFCWSSGANQTVHTKSSTSGSSSSSSTSELNYHTFQGRRDMLFRHKEWATAMLGNSGYWLWSNMFHVHRRRHMGDEMRRDEEDHAQQWKWKSCSRQFQTLFIRALRRKTDWCLEMGRGCRKYIIRRERIICMGIGRLLHFFLPFHRQFNEIIFFNNKFNL